MVLAVHNFAVTARYRDLTTLEGLLDEGQALAPGVLAQFAAGLDGASLPCRHEVIEAAVDIAVADANRRIPFNDRDGWLLSLKRVENLAEQGLKCNPTNGLLWARLAVARWFRGGRADEQAYLLTMSQAYAPAELQVISARISQWRKVSPAVIDLARTAVESDMRTILLYAAPRSAKSMLSDLPGHLLDIFSSQVAILPADRLAALRETGLIL